MGCCAVYFFLNLLSQQKSIGIFSVISIMGYGLLPIVVLAAIAITISLKYVCVLSQLVPHGRSWSVFVGVHLRGYFGLVVGFVAVGWATVTAARFFEKSLNLLHQRWLIAYPVFLFYCCFVLMTVF